MLRLSRFLILAGLLSGSLAYSQTSISTSDQEDTDPASIEGYIVKSGTGEPLGKARVVLRPIQGREPVFGAVTDTGGRFFLANIQAGSYRLHIERDGYVDQQYGQVSSNRPGTVLVLVSGQEVQDVLVSLVPTGTISGRVYDEDGEPIVGASVRAFRYQYGADGRILAPVRQTQTNDLGEYRLYWLTPGEYYISATFEARFRAASALRESVLAGALPVLDLRGGAPVALGAADPMDAIYVDTYYPGTHDPVTASALTVTPASELSAIDFTVLPTRAVVLRGSVVGPFSEQEGLVPTVTIVQRNSTVAASRIAFRGGGRGGRGGGGVNSDGTFELAGVAPGSYTLVALIRSRQGRGGGGGGAQMAGFLNIEVGADDVEGLFISVLSSVPVTGRVLVDQSASQINLSRMRVRLQAVGNLPVGSPNGRVEADGTFAIDSVSQTMHRVSLTGLPDGAYVAAAYIGGRDILGDGIQVTGDLGPIEFWVSGSGGTLDGTIRIRSDQTYTGAQVVLIPDDPERNDLYKVASADQYGRFTTTGIAPGSYRAFAWEDAPAGAFQDPGFVNLYEDFGERIEIEQASQSQIQPQLIRSRP
jgi:5-hydroxyisourate hydrolase-like protein (transthyretin family)